jgi:hypothetical protein
LEPKKQIGGQSSLRITKSVSKKWGALHHMQNFLQNFIAFLGGAISIYLKFRQGKRKLQILQIYRASAKELVLGTVGDLKLSYNDKIYSNITAFEYLVFNDGTVPIDGEDVKPEVPITLSCGNDSEFLDYKLVSQSTKNIEAELGFISSNSVLIKFQWLYKNSGIRIKCLCAGETPKLTVNGKVKGIAPLNKIEEFKHESLLTSIEQVFSRISRGFDSLLKITALLSTSYLFILLFISCGSDPVIKNRAYIYPPFSVLSEQINLMSFLRSAQPIIADSSIVQNFNIADDSVLLDTLIIDNLKLSFAWQPDAFARSIADSLRKEDYTVNYISAESLDITDQTEMQELVSRNPKTGETYRVQLLIEKEFSWIEFFSKEFSFWNYLKNLRWLFLFYVVISIVFVFFYGRNLFHLWRYYDLTTSDEKQYLKKHGESFIVKVVAKLLKMKRYRD